MVSWLSRGGCSAYASGGRGGHRRGLSGPSSPNGPGRLSGRERHGRQRSTTAWDRGSTLELYTMSSLGPYIQCLP